VLELAPPLAGPDITLAAAEGWRMRLAHALRVATRDTAVGAMGTRSARLELSAALGSDGGTALLRNVRTSRIVWSGPVAAGDSQIYRVARAVRLTLCDLEARASAQPSADPASAWTTLWMQPQSAESNGSALRSVARARRINASARWLAIKAYAYWRAARYGWNGVKRAEGLRISLDACERALELDPGHVDARFVLAMTHFELGDLELGIAGLEQVVQLDPSHGPALGNLGHAYMMRGAYEAAFSHCERALVISAREPLATLWHGSRSFIHAMSDQVSEARTAAVAAVLSNPKHRFGLLALAVARELEGNTQAVRRLVARIRSLPDSAFAGPLDVPGYALCKGAFREEAAAMMDRLRAALGPRAAVVRTPSRLRVLTLGRFCIEREGQRIAWGRKAPQSLLRLLKVLVAFGGRDVEVERITEALWPDETGRSVRRRFDTALYRLRSVLGADVVRADGSVVSLSSETLDVDAFAFRDGGSISLYVGRFLPGDMHAPWSVPMREALAERFRAEIARSVEALLKHGEGARALSCCAQAMTIEPLSEVLCRLALRASLEVGRRDDGQRLYDMHAAALRTELDLAPDAATQKLHRALRSEQASV
jgi:DNA-binding SARP family transcriptional activator